MLMSNLILFIWYIGVIFTIGALDANKIRKWWQVLIMLLFCVVAWPGVLGEIVGRKLRQ